ncbi:hypothetical protein SDC9_148887 [bioreactor metagenome]|uniref:Uncharacterized protein n=1 Tax=bioreactor metagenome TaxID=1076179 RepID=A0A645EJQ2_9ZZZZ
MGEELFRSKCRSGLHNLDRDSKKVCELCDGLVHMSSTHQKQGVGINRKAQMARPGRAFQKQGLLFLQYSLCRFKEGRMDRPDGCSSLTETKNGRGGLQLQTKDMIKFCFLPLAQADEGMSLLFKGAGEQVEVDSSCCQHFTLVHRE